MAFALFSLCLDLLKKKGEISIAQDPFPPFITLPLYEQRPSSKPNGRRALFFASTSKSTTKARRIAKAFYEPSPASQDGAKIFLGDARYTDGIQFLQTA